MIQLVKLKRKVIIKGYGYFGYRYQISEEFENVYNIGQIKIVGENFVSWEIGGNKGPIKDLNLYGFDFNHVSREIIEMEHMEYGPIIQNLAIITEIVEGVISYRVT